MYHTHGVQYLWNRRCEFVVFLVLRSRFCVNSDSDRHHHTTEMHAAPARECLTFASHFGEFAFAQVSTHLLNIRLFFFNVESPSGRLQRTLVCLSYNSRSPSLNATAPQRRPINFFCSIMLAFTVVKRPALDVNALTLTGNCCKVTSHQTACAERLRSDPFSAHLQTRIPRQPLLCPPLFPPLFEPTTNAFVNINDVAVTTT